MVAVRSLWLAQSGLSGSAPLNALFLPLHLSRARRARIACEFAAAVASRATTGKRADRRNGRHSVSARLLRNVDFTDHR
jgi:hypothetical protein